MSERAGHVKAWSGLAPRAIALGILTIAVLTWVAYLPAMRGKFLWDDDWLLVNNDVVHAPDGLWRVWTTDAKYFWPVTNTVFWLEWRLFGTNTVGYHLVNLVLHIGAALLVWLLLHRLEIPGGFLAALLWAVHPVSVEGVAWISQLKTVLSTVFLLLSMLAYLKADDQMWAESGQRGFEGARSYWLSVLTFLLWYCLSVLAFLLGMLSKASIAPLPLMLLLVIWWRHGSIAGWDLVRMVPFFVVAVVLVPVNMWFETHGSGEVFREASFLERLLGAAAVPWFYLGKALVPLNLMFIYPMWSIDAGNVLWWLPLVASIAVTAVLLWQRNTWWGRSLLFAWAFFWVGLIPVLGFTDVRLMAYTLISDHYQYISLIAVTALVAAGWTMWFRRAASSATTRPGWLSSAAPLATAAVAVAVLSVLTRQESGTYQDEATLLQATIDRNPECWIARCGLGITLSGTGRTLEGLAQFEEMLRLNPAFAVGHDHCGRALMAMGRLKESASYFEEAIRLDPELAGAHNNLGTVLCQLNRIEEGIAHFETAIKIKPDLAAAHTNLAVTLYQLGRYEEAAKELEEAVRLNPAQYETLSNLGTTLVKLGRPLEAIGRLQEALRLKPDSALIHLNLGHALLSAGRTEEAMKHYELCLQAEPNSATAWANVAIAKSRLERDDEAIRAGQKALSLARSEGRTAVADQIEQWLRTTYGDALASPNAPAAPEQPPAP